MREPFPPREQLTFFLPCDKIDLNQTAYRSIVNKEENKMDIISALLLAVPATGDNFPAQKLLIVAGIAVAVAAVTIIAAFFRKKDDDDEE